MNTQTIKTYLVGGAVRDHLLGLPVKDRDWVVVGADAQTMLAQGYQPVGKDFPVFLTRTATKNTPSPVPSVKLPKAMPDSVFMPIKTLRWNKT